MTSFAPRPLVIASRQSPLAQAQAQIVLGMLEAAQRANDSQTRYHFEIKTYVTSGDRHQQGALADIGGKGLFTREVEAALLAGEADIAVHSLKDMPVVMPDGLMIGAIPPRAVPLDAFISPVAAHPGDLPRGAIIGTSSVRRAAQIRHMRPDLEVAPLRGSVGTRLDRLAHGAVAATFLAEAGLRRLGLKEVARTVLPPEEMLPALCQGALLVQIPSGRPELVALLAPVTCRKTSVEITAERALLERLDGSCRTPVAGLAEMTEINPGGAGPEGALRFRAALYASYGQGEAGEQGEAGFDERLPVSADTALQDVHRWATALGAALLEEAASFWPGTGS